MLLLEPLEVRMLLLFDIIYPHLKGVSSLLWALFYLSFSFHTSIMQTVFVSKDLGNSQELWLHDQYPNRSIVDVIG